MMRHNPRSSLTLKILLTSALALVGLGAQSAPPAQAPQMVAHNLQQIGQPEVDALRRLWQDRLAISEPKWEATPYAKTLPAFTLTQAFPGRQPSISASILFDLYDCEMPGNGRGMEDMYAQCPMRVVIGSGENRVVKTFERVCYLQVDRSPPGQGPQPEKNFTSVSLEGPSSLRVRVTQYGKDVPACNRVYSFR